MAGFDFVSEADEHFEADSQVELVAQLSAAAAEVDDDVAEVLGIDGGDVAVPGAADIVSRRDRSRGIKSPAWAATISRNFSRPAPEEIAFSSRLRAAATVDSRLARTSNSAPSSSVTSIKSAGPFALQRVDRFVDFDGVAGHAAERLIHVGQQGGGLHAHALADVDHRLGQRAGIGRATS